jgi:hypothetical protein
MTCHCAQGNLDLGRGIVISRAAYESRTKGKEPPPIVEARFQTPDGKILCEYDNSSKAGLKYLSWFKPKQSNQAKPDIDDEVPW